MTTYEPSRLWSRIGRLLMATGFSLLLMAALWLLLVQSHPALAHDVAPAALTPITVRNEAGALQPAVIVALRNQCHDPSLVTVANIASYPVSLDLAQGDCLLALAPQHFVTTTKAFHAFPLFAPFGATGNIAYAVVTTNWTVQADGTIISPTVSSPGAPLQLTTRVNAPLVLFNLLVSLEWDVHEASETGVFTSALDAFSGHLFDASNGQMAVGQAQIVAGASHWRDADFQIMAANDVWPNADVGGIVAAPTQLANGVGFRPGHLRVGRAWDGNSANQGPWNQRTGALTLLHEFGHYGLALFDEYLGLAPDGADFPSFCTASPSDPAYGEQWATLMSYQYKANELALRGANNVMQWAARCLQTIQFQMYSQSDWETLAAGFADANAPRRWQIQLPVSGPNPGPESTPPGLTSIQITPSANAPPTRTLAVVGVPAGVSELQVYQFAGPGHPGGPRLVSQGVITSSNNLRLLGVYGGDELLIIDPEGLVYTRTVVPGSNTALTVTVTQPGWSPKLLLTPLASQQVSVSLAGVGNLAGLGVSLFERGSANAPQTLTLSSVGGISQTVFSAPLPDFAGFLYLHAAGGRETVAPFALSAGAPSVHDTAHSPRADAHLVRTGAAAQQPAIFWDSRGQPPAPPGEQLIGARTGVNVAGAAALDETTADLERPLALWLNMRPDELPGGRPSCLILSHADMNTQEWMPLGLVNELPEHVVSLPVMRTGAFALVRREGACLYKRVEAPNPIIGAVVTYTIGLDNPTDQWQPNALVIDQLPNQLQPLTITSNLPGAGSFNGQTATWYGSVPPHTLLVITIVTTLRSSAALNQAIANQAQAQVLGATLVSTPAVFRTCHRLDINCDGAINIMDIVAAAEAWNAAMVNGGPQAYYDVDRDGRVTVLDIQTIAAAWGWVW